MNLTTPALLFPAISLLLLAYTNRFLVLAQLIRQLNTRDNQNLRGMVIRQIDNLKKRIVLTKTMQVFGALSFLLCTFSMAALFLEQQMLGRWIFGLSLASLSISLLISIYEIHISCDAIYIELEWMESKKKEGVLDDRR